MLVFILPLRARAVSADWVVTSQLLGRTLRNLRCQTSSSWRAIVVGHDRPELDEFRDERIKFLAQEMPVPTSPAEMMNDKMEKTSAGCVAAFELTTMLDDVSLMLVDPDDLVSRQITQHVHESDDENGTYVKSGYIHSVGARWCIKSESFDRFCGTSSILRIKKNGRMCFRSVGNLSEILNKGHHLRRELMQQIGSPLVPLPFLGAVYTIGTGQNWSGAVTRAFFGSKRQTLTSVLSVRAVTPRMRQEFPGLV